MRDHQQSSLWPALTVESWSETRHSLHLWLQIIGKLQLANTTLLNHWWNAPYEVSTRGLRTHTMDQGKLSFDAEFDFIEDNLLIRTSSGGEERIGLRARSVAGFWTDVTASLARLGIDPSMSGQPNEVEPAIPFAEDTAPRTYDPEAARTFWEQLRLADRVFSQWRARFGGKSGPSQFFWGSMDLACSRFSGRPAPLHQGSPPNCPPWVMQEAESMENITVGFWPGGSDEGSFYGYCYPEPPGFRNGRIDEAIYHTQLGEWILPYKSVRQSKNPEDTLLRFIEEIYERGADPRRWNRSAVDIDPHRLDQHLNGH